MNSIFLELEFFLLVIFSFVVPIGIYIYLYRKKSVSRSIVLALAVSLIAVSALDVVLLQSLADVAKSKEPSLGVQFFAKEVSLTLYLLPAVFAGIGVNLISHVLINHLNRAEKRFDNEHHTNT